MNRKILMIAATPFYLEKGSSLRVRQMVEYASSISSEVDLITYPVGRNIDVKENNLNIFRTPFPFYNKKSPGPSLSKLIMDLLLLIYSLTFVVKKDYDLVQGEDVEGGLIAAIIGKITNIPNVYSIHLPLLETLKKYDMPKPLTPFLLSIQNILYYTPSAFLTEWEHGKIFLEKNFDKKIFSHIPDTFPRREKEPSKEIREDYIIYVGNFKEYQGVRLLLKAFHEFKKGNEKDIKLLLVGDRSKEITEEIERLSLTEDTHVLGKKSIEKTNYYISNALLAVLPRIKDGPPGMKALHYESRETPIIATDLSCNRKSLRGKARFCEPDSNQMAQMINAIITDENERKKLVKKMESEKYLDDAKNKEKLRSFYDKVRKYREKF